MKEYKVGILGFGFIGKVHAYGYLNLPLFYDPPPLRARITHVCTSRDETARKGAAQIGADHSVTDASEILENPEVDIVHICTPNDRHKAELLAAIRNNKHIYCDKPLVCDQAEANEIQAALKDYKGIAQMTFQLRFFPAVMRAKQLIEEGFLGKVLEFRATYLHGGSADPSAPAKWKLTAARGGGVIADLASHVLDLIHHLLGDYTSLMAETHIAYPQRPDVKDPTVKVAVDAEDSVMMLVRMASEALGTIGATKIATGVEDEMRFEIHGSRGALRFNLMDAHHLEVFDATSASGPIGGNRGWTRVATGQRFPAPAATFPSPKASIGWMRSHVACLANFLQSIANGTPAQPGLEQGILVQHLMECARESVRSKGWVSV